MKISLFFVHSGANPVPAAFSLKNDDADKKAKTLRAKLAQMGEPTGPFPISINGKSRSCFRLMSHEKEGATSDNQINIAKGLVAELSNRSTM
jgi:hypothetical protein